MKPDINVFFAGAGLIEIGLNESGLAVQQSFEIDRACCDTQRENFDHDVVQCDVRTKLVNQGKRCNVMIGSYPCNRYSPIGDIHAVRTGDDLYLHFFRHLAIELPEVYVLENVPGMRKFPVVMEAMTRLPNYYVHVFCPIQSQLWLPQRRDRLIIFGSRRAFQWNAPSARRRLALKDVLERNPQIEIPAYVRKRMRGGYRDLPIISDPRKGDIAPTCVAHYAKDLSTRMVVDLRFPNGLRPYTVREYARLQGVPDWFSFVGGDCAAYRMIGNGVSTPVGRWIGNELKRYFKLN